LIVAIARAIHLTAPSGRRTREQANATGKEKRQQQDDAVQISKIHGDFLRRAHQQINAALQSTPGWKKRPS